jgi:type I restriction enzyme S subunit
MKDIKYISTKKAQGLNYHSFVGGDLVLAKLGDPVGKTCIVPRNMKYGIVVSDVVRIRLNKNLCDKNFLVYLLNSRLTKDQLYQDIIGTTRPRVNLSKIRNLVYAFPKQNEQNRISLSLSSADNAIDKEISYKNKLLALKQGLMNDLLTGKVRVNHLIKTKETRD